MNRKIVVSRAGWSSFFSVLPLLFYLANLYRMTGNSTMPYRAFIYFVGGLGVLKAVLSSKQNALFILIALLYFLTDIFDWLIIGNISITDAASDILFFGMAYIMLRYPSNYQCGLITFYTTAALFVFFYMRGMNTHYVLTSSGNYISVVLILSASLYYISLHNSKKKMRSIDMIPAVLCFFFSVWAKGRGGILSTGILLILILVLYMQNITKKAGKRILWLVIILMIAATVILSSDMSISNWFFSLGKWRYKGTDNTARIVLWRSYFAKLKESFVYCLFGAPLQDIPAIAGKGNNCHNSFIQLHAYNGMIMIAVLLYLLVKSIKSYWKNKDHLLLIVLIVYCVRAFSDKFVFGQYGMPIMMYLLLEPYYNQQCKSWRKAA